MLNFNSVLVFSDNVSEMGEFYKKVFQKEPDMTDGGYFGFLVGSGFFTVGPHDEVHGSSKDPKRIMFNCETKDVKEEFERIKAIDGVEVIAEPYQMEGWDGWIATLADLDGNYFQLMPPWEGNK